MSRRDQRKYLVFAGIGFELLGLIMVALYLGKELDQNYSLKGMATAGLSMLALVLWLWHLIVLTKRIDKTGGS